MRIACPHCGEREIGEFTYLGDASPKRPAIGAPEAGDVEDAFFDYVYLRDNPAGDTTEYWYHGLGCRSWLLAIRNTMTHAFLSVDAAGTGRAAGNGEVGDE